jgi:hypothetical protein
MAQVAKKMGVSLFKVTTPSGFEIQFLHEEGYAKAYEVTHWDRASRTVVNNA